MRIFTIVLIALLSLSVFAREIELSSENVNLGVIAQDEFRPAQEVLDFIRPVNGPEQVALSYALKTQETVCAAWESRSIWIPERTDIVCNTINNQTICTPIIIPGRYDIQNVCVKTEERMVIEDKKIYLDFKKASDLVSFSLEFKQNDVRREGHEIKALNADNFSVKETSVLGFKRTLKFKSL